MKIDRKLKKLEQKRLKRIAKYEIANRQLIRKYEMLKHQNQVLLVHGIVNCLVNNGCGLSEANTFASSYVNNGREHVSINYQQFKQKNNTIYQLKHRFLVWLDEFLEKVGHRYDKYTPKT